MVIANYALHLLCAAVLLILFFLLYCKATPFDEMALIRRGNSAAALSFSGALIGFSLTVAAGFLRTDSVLEAIYWAAGAAVVQLLVYVLVTRLLHMSKDHIENGNVAFGGLLGAISLSVGAINAACLS